MTEAVPPWERPAGIRAAGGGGQGQGRIWQTRRNPATQSHGTKARTWRQPGALCPPGCVQTTGNRGAQRHGA